MAGIGSVVIQFKAQSDQARREIGRISGALNKVGDNSKKASSGLEKLKKFGVGAAAGIAGGLAVGAAAAWNFAEAAIADEAGAEKLAGALKKAAKATSAQIGATEDWITAQGIAKGFADDKLRPALVRLTRATGKVKDAQDLATIAMDISAETGKDLTTVAEGLAKASDGNINALKRMGITLGKEAENAIDYAAEVKKLNDLQHDAAVKYEEAGAGSEEYRAAAKKVAEQQKIVNDLAKSGVDWQDELGKAYKGAAKRAAQTTQGTWDRVKLIFGEIGESIGGFAIPMLGEFADWFGKKKNQKNVQEWIDKIGEWSTSIGETFKGKIEDFVTYLNSPEGKTATANFSQDLKDIASGFASIADGINSVGSAISTVVNSEAFKKALMFLGLDESADAAARQKRYEEEMAKYGYSPGTLGDNGSGSGGGGSWGNSNAISGTNRSSDEGPVKKGGKGSSTTVNIVINNPKAEKASTSIAAAHRSAKYLDKRTGGLA